MLLMQTIVNDSIDGEFISLNFSAAMKENINCALFVGFFLYRRVMMRRWPF